MDLNQRISLLQNKIARLEFAQASSKRAITKLNTEISELERQFEVYTKAIRLCDYCLEEQAGLKTDIEDMVTFWLHHLFDTNTEVYTFKFENVYKADKVTLSGLRPTVFKNGVADKSGQAMRDAISFALRLAAQSLNPDLCPMMFLDEGFVSFNKDKFEKFGMVVTEIQKSIPFRMLIVTHTDLKLGKLYNGKMESDSVLLEVT